MGGRNTTLAKRRGRVNTPSAHVECWVALTSKELAAVWNWSSNMDRNAAKSGTCDIEWKRATDLPAPMLRGWPLAFLVWAWSFARSEQCSPTSECGGGTMPSRTLHNAKELNPDRSDALIASTTACSDLMVCLFIWVFLWRMSTDFPFPPSRTRALTWRGQRILV